MFNWSAAILIIREAPRRILIDLIFEVPNRIIIRRGRFLFNGVEILISPDALSVANNQVTLSANLFANCPFALLVGPHPPGIRAPLYFRNVSRYQGYGPQSHQWIEDNIEGAGSSNIDQQ